MITWDPKAPTLAGLRPGRVSKPLVKDLTGVLVEPTEPPIWPTESPIPFVMATLATYAYSDTGTIAAMATRLGLDGHHCRLAAEIVDVLFVRSTAYLIQSADGRAVILAYRGTSPTSAINWLGDLDIDPEPVPLGLAGHSGEYDVHRGFYRNVRSTGYQVVDGLLRALDGFAVDDPDEHGNYKPVEHKMEALYITGHSLGGAMAMLAAILLRSDDDYRRLIGCLRGVYTFGAPMVCEPALAHLCDQPDVLGGKVVRYVYNDDVVPQLPPKASGPFHHFGTELRYHPKDQAWKERDKPTGQMRHLISLAEIVPSFLARQIELTRNLPFQASISDHLPQHYLAALAPPGVRTEFGD